MAKELPQDTIWKITTSKALQQYQKIWEKTSGIKGRVNGSYLLLAFCLSLAWLLTTMKNKRKYYYSKKNGYTLVDFCTFFLHILSSFMHTKPLHI